MSKLRSRVMQGLLTTALAVGTLVATPAVASASTCGINVGGHQGYYICEYEPTLVQWPDGHYQWFVVGTDNHVYDSHQLSPGSSSWGPWHDLGGVAKSGVDVTYLSSSRIDLKVWGTYNGYWCKRWTGSGGWTNWWDC
ncbi:hypothetical protein ABT024_36740 [Streptomyces sp. NPDC002812]|uniref:hypothetical protein n=1 Tax=unclassified Streptomyces TaxID=2593676 RepID=UPI0022546309|nr:hypothetical protein [Streptomyces sp. NBC_00347]MCX5129393.1 hypothetical protein [Streptomyces sp. NBC_00347]